MEVINQAGHGFYRLQCVSTLADCWVQACNEMPLAERGRPDTCFRQSENWCALPPIRDSVIVKRELFF